MDQTQFTFVRHGESWSNVRKELACKLRDDWLSDKGQLQAMQTADYLEEKHREKPYTAIISSTLKRTVQTATYLASRLGLHVYQTPLITEYNFGDLEKLENNADTWAKFYEIFDQWPEKPDISFPNGESYTDINSRLEEFLKDTITEFQGQNIIVVSHAGPIFTIVKNFSFSSPIPIPNCSVTKLETNDQKYPLIAKQIGNIDHLSGIAAEVISPSPRGQK